MTLQELKLAIESEAVPESLIIFKNSESSFIASQYTRMIAVKKGLEINYLEDLKGVLQEYDSIFNDLALKTDSILNVYKVDTLKYIPPSISQINNLIIITNKIEDKESEMLFNSNIINVPKLEDWQWKDYVYSLCEGVDTSDLDWLLSICKDKDRLDNEVQKISLFREGERKYLFEDLIRDGFLDDLTSYNIFNVVNILCRKDIDSLKLLMNDLSKIDINGFGLLTLLTKNFKNLLTVQLSFNPTPESTGIDSKQLYALKKIPKVFSQEQLINIYSFMCDIDRKVKEGYLPNDIMVDYLITKILTI